MGIRRPNCFAVKHQMDAAPILVPDTEITVFEDITTNHNKTLFTIFNNSGTSTVVISIRTDAGELPPIELPPKASPLFEEGSPISLQVENARQVTFRTLDPGTFADVNWIITETFCMCCMNHTCSIDTHTVNDTLILEAVDRTVFQDFTSNHNKTMVKIINTAVTDALLTFRTDQGIVNKTVTFPRPYVIQLEDLREISLTGSALVEIQKSFCICCP